MSHLKDLINRFCPNGVPFKPLGEVCELLSGKLNANAMEEHGIYPFFTCSEKVYQINNYAFDGEALLIAGNGYIGNVKYHKGKFNAYQRTYVLMQFVPEIQAKFLYYFLDAFFRTYALNEQKQASVPYITLNTLAQFLIPIPPIEVQQEIARILDLFTNYATELQAELQARKEQYEYYRNLLLTFNPSASGSGTDDKQNIQWLPLEEVFELRNGYTPSKNNSDYWEGGTIPWFRMEDIRENGRILSDSIQHITPEAIKGKGLFEANSFILTTTATIGEHALIIADSLANQRFTNLKVRKSLTDKLLTKFIYYYMFIVDEFCKNNTNVSGFASVDMGKLKKMPFPIPPLPMQKRIVAILDRFEALVNDLTKGIPAEISARREQYEYYRNRLLTFKQSN
ncbi:MAG: restriction endonuclease subunit S [Bacteroides sp.]|nr:restriction endonuclease subunit S [Bacteroides sp.]MCM1379747.1 restriction endonuclease subunit S [Bacteroides sp.]MCM1445712.1 restriction endonuclease subunit S [Prevotella sp.]